MLIKLFSGAGATGHVFFLKGGKAVDKGLAHSGLIGPLTTVAVVPTTTQVLEFSVEARTKDKQGITVTGDLKVVLSPKDALSNFDFTVNPKDGSFKSPWDQALRALVIECVLAPIHEKAKTLDVETATQSHKDFEEAVKASLTSAGTPLSRKGVRVESCSIASVEANDEEVAESIGSKERQERLTAHDKATHDRRLKGANNERVVKKYEADTKLELEKKQGVLLAEQAKNKKVEATTDAEATQIRLAPLKDVEGGKLLGAALMEAAKSGRLGSVSITSELLAAVGQK